MFSHSKFCAVCGKTCDLMVLSQSESSFKLCTDCLGQKKSVLQ